MPNAADIEWFKDQFHARIAVAVAGTPFDVDFLAALACQETGEIWPILRNKALTVDEILALCVGDTIDASGGRSAFPRTKDELIALPDGDRMFDIAHEALVAMAKYIPSYKGPASKANKFCHGFGLFQYDLQFFKKEPAYFLERRYERFEETLGKCLEELRRAQNKIGFGDRTELSDMEQAFVAIAYNTGGFKPARGLQQGFKSDDGKFYGEQVFAFIRLAHQVATNGAAPTIATPPPGQAAVPPPTPIAATGAFFVVDTDVSTLRLRREPKLSVPRTANVIADLPEGQIVQAVDDGVRNGFREVETSLHGAHVRGFAADEFLRPAPEAHAVPIVVPAATPPGHGIVAVSMPAGGSITKRTALAGAHSLNEPGQPGRVGTTAADLCEELRAIVDWLAVDKATHKRYQPRNGLTFCNIYAHDYCHLAGVYLPRVWWTPGAIERLAAGEDVEPLYEATIEEVRANGLFRWLRDFGERFGWRQTGTLTKLQQEVDLGAIGLIVARRKEDGKPGHIAVVVPESADERARRDQNGDVIAPLQSQAGATNFRYGTGKLEWWKGQQFADSGFWLHA